MIYVIESKGKGDSRADYVTLRTFLSEREANVYIQKYTQKNSDGHKYWTRFDIVEPGERIEPYAE
jgi:hypothetical protein